MKSAGTPSAEVAWEVVVGGEGAVTAVNAANIGFSPLVGSRLWSLLTSVPWHCV